MKNRNTSIGIILAIFASFGSGFLFARSKHHQDETPGSCFANGGQDADMVIGRVAEEEVSQNILPLDLRERFNNSQLQNYEQSKQLLEEFAVRRAIAGNAASARELPTLSKSMGNSITDSELRNYYSIHKESFGKRTFEDIAPQLKQYIQERRSESFFRERLIALQELGTIKSLLPVPCGISGYGKAPTGIHYLGSESAKTQLYFFTDYSTESKVIDTKLQKLSEDLGKDFKVIVHPTPRLAEPLSVALTKGFWCAAKQNIGVAQKFHKAAVLGNTALAVKGSGVREAELAAHAHVMGVAKEIQLLEQPFSECLDSTDTDKIIQEKFNLANKYGATKTPSIFINGKELLISKMLDVDVTVRSVVTDLLGK